METIIDIGRSCTMVISETSWNIRMSVFTERNRISERRKFLDRCLMYKIDRKVRPRLTTSEIYEYLSLSARGSILDLRFDFLFEKFLQNNTRLFIQRKCFLCTDHTILSSNYSRRCGRVQIYVVWLEIIPQPFNEIK